MDEKPAPAYDRNLKGFLQALNTGTRRALGARFFSFRKNPFIRAGKAQVISPLSVTRQQLTQLASSYQPAAEYRAYDPLEGLPTDEANRRIMNCRRHWALYLAVAVMSVLYLPARMALGGHLGFVASAQAMAFFFYGASLTLRCARDHAAMQRRQSYAMREFYSVVDELWCPWPEGSRERWMAIGIGGVSMMGAIALLGVLLWAR